MIRESQVCHMQVDVGGMPGEPDSFPSGRPQSTPKQKCSFADDDNDIENPPSLIPLGYIPFGLISPLSSL